MANQTISMPLLDFRAEFRPATIDEDARTIEVAAATTTGVQRYDWRTGGYFIEELSMKPKHVRMDRLKNKAPILDSHYGWRMEHVLGVVERASLSGNELLCKLRYVKGDVDVDKVWNKIRQGAAPKISIGYRVYKYRDITKQDDPMPRRLAIDWEPKEVSPVPIAADDNAGVRSDKQGEKPEMFICEIETREDAPVGENEEMNLTELCRSLGINPEEEFGRSLIASGVSVEEARKRIQAHLASPEGQRSEGGSPSAEEAAEQQRAEAETAEAARLAEQSSQRGDTPVTAADMQAAAERAVVEDRRRQSSIRTLCRTHGIDLEQDFARDMIDGNTDIEAARGLVLEHLATRSDASPTSGHIVITEDDRQKRGTAMGNALAHRCDESVELNAGGRQFRGMSLVEMARASMGRDGMGLTPWDVATRALIHTTDFPLLLSNLATKTLLDFYKETDRTFMPFCRRADIADFKPVTRIKLGDFPSMKKVNEAGEVTRGVFSEKGETYQLSTYARSVAFTRQAMVNDDLDGFMRLLQQSGAASARLQNDVVWDIITGNPLMSDGFNLFHANHGNVATDALDETGLSNGRKSMRTQQTLDGNFMAVHPVFLIVSEADLTKAEKLISAVQATQTSNVNVFANKLKIISEPRLDANDDTIWYLATTPSQVDTIEYAYLRGEGDSPMIETRNGFEVEGMEMKIRQDFAAKAIDHPGLYQSDAP